MTDRLVASAKREPDAHGQVRPRRYPVRAIVVALFIAVLGPPIGYLFLFVVGMANLAILVLTEPLPDGQIQKELSVAFGLLPFSYLVGGAQAAMTGAWLGLRTYFRGSVALRDVALAALAASLAVTVVNLLRGGDFNMLDHGIPSDVLLAVVSVLAAVACGLLLRALGVLPPPGGEKNPSA